MNSEFWDYLQHLVDSSQIILDRPKGTIHPRFAQQPYPVSYGYLSGTTAIDAGGVDIWVGSAEEKKVNGVLCTVDLLKRDTELKIIFDCTDDEVEKILHFVNSGEMRAIFLNNKR
jgi:inorganic pyrophosphatase